MDAVLNQEIYQQLKSIANKLMQAERQGHTLSPTDLVHEAYLKINLPDDSSIKGQQYLFVLARQMRRLLVDYGRRNSALKRGGERQRVVYTDALGINDNSITNFQVISDAIDGLESLDERAAKAIDLLYFTQVKKHQAADILNISVATLERDLRFAKAHICNYLSEHAE